MKRALFIVLLVAALLVVVLPLATTARADGPNGYGGYGGYAHAGYGNGYGYGYGYGYVYPGSGYNKVCMYSYWNCSYRFVPPYPVSGYYQYPYNTYNGQNNAYHKSNHYNPNNCTPGLYCNQGYGMGYGMGYGY
jgi:hypothetical protein